MAGMVKIVLNGKFLSQKITGVQRYAREILNCLDPLVADLDIEIVMAEDAKDIPSLKNIKKITLSGKASVFWEQVKLPFYIKRQKAIGLHLCHVAPLLKPDIVCIHDTNVARNPQWFTKKIFLWYGLIHKVCAMRAKKILTVSEFSKKELQDIFKISDSRIENIGSGWQHVQRISNDQKTLEQYDLKEKNFYFSLGTRAPHKNIHWIYEYAQKHPESTFAMSGSSYGRIFGRIKETIPENVKCLGYLSDEEIKSLMQSCKAFVFPSFYEGFGLPPLEALSSGAKVIVSDIPVMREIFGGTVLYINPNNTNVDLDQLIKESVAPATTVLEKYSWQKGAKALLEIIKNIQV